MALIKKKRDAFMKNILRLQICRSWLAGLLVFFLPGISQAQFTFTTNNGAITITGYTGSGGNVVIPGTTNGYPVTAIGASAFSHQTTLTNLTIP